MFEKLYQNYLLKYPKLFFAMVMVVMGVMMFNLTKLEIDASAQTLLLEGDKDLEFTRKISKDFTANDLLIVTYSIEDDLLSEQNLQNIQNISDEILQLNNIHSVTSILNVPLLQSPPRPIKELVGDVKTLQTSRVDKSLVKKEFLTSPIYKKNLVSEDFQTTAIMINLQRDEKYASLISQEERFIKLKGEQKLSKNSLEAYNILKKELKEYRDIQRLENHQLIKDIRQILQKYQQSTKATLHLGGANMVADDMVEFVKNDLKIFGSVIFLLLIIVLYGLLKEIRWVFIALFISIVSIVITSGFFGAIGWEITVVSSNFISLQLIMNISLVIHLIIKYKELLTLHPSYTQKQLLQNTVVAMAKPSFFVVITTIAGFCSLIFSNILPVIHFGWMMSTGIVVSLIITFLLFPIVLSFLPIGKEDKFSKNDIPFTAKIAHLIFDSKKLILFLTAVVIIFSITGATKLRVENSFIDYFKKDTQIYQGMKLIDQKLGGTTPLDVVLTFKQNSDEVEALEVKISDQLQEDFMEFEEEFELQTDEAQNYWFTASKIEKIKQIHSYLESLQPIGKVLSLATLVEVGKSLNNGEELDGVTLALMNQELPLEYKEVILSPYVNVEKNTARITTRVIDSQEGLQRDLLLKQIDKDIQKIINPVTEEYRVSNLLVMYNNMLQSLFDSQIKTIGLVVLILFGMFLILFRDLKIAIVAIIANTVPVGVIFGFMGWMDIPLDMMTITIAAISIGIAVDDTIHYIHRYRLEVQQTNNIEKSIINAHKSIGRAMFYTSSIIMIGFSILVLSNFIPTIYFGLLTMMAMFMAIVADLLLLPVLLMVFKTR